MADYVYTTDKVLNSFKKIMADKEVWRINRGRINEYSLYQGVILLVLAKSIIQIKLPITFTK